MFPWSNDRGGAEKKIRKYLIENNFVEAVIQLPDKLFYGTSIATSIMVLKKSKINSDTLFIDATEQFEKVTNNNKLENNHIETILEAYKNRETNDNFAKLVTKEEIEEQDYNLSVSTYVNQSSKKEEINIEELNSNLNNVVTEENELREKINSIINEIKAS